MNLKDSPKNMEVNKFIVYAADTTILVTKISVNSTLPLLEIKEKKANNSPQKFRDPGTDILAKDKRRNMIDNNGVVIEIPFRSLIILEWDLSYNEVTAIKRPELTKPWANIMTTAAVSPSVQKLKIPKVTKPM